MGIKAIGVDLGGSHVLATIVDDQGSISQRVEHEIADRTPEAVVETIAQAVSDVMALGKDKTYAGIGLGSPGNIDAATGTVRYSPNFGWHDVKLGSMLRERFDVPIFIGNDARCATLGEYVHGRLILGTQGGAGEIGHHQVRATDGFYCNCGKTGCFEAQASGTGLIRHALAIAPSFPRSVLVSAKPEKLGSKSIRKAAEAGDPHGVAAWNRYTEDLATGIANVIAFVNPQTIALGGGVAAAGKFMLDAIHPRVEALTTMVPRGKTNVVCAILGNDAGAIGAAEMARRGGLTTAAAAPD